MFDPLSLGLIYGSYWLNKKLGESRSRQQSVPECRVCSSPAVDETSCCSTPLCKYCIAEWKRDPNPCPCKRR